MEPIIRSTYPLPDLGDNSPICVAAGSAEDRKLAVVGSERRLFRLDLSVGSWETFVIGGLSGNITDVAVAADGGFYLGDKDRIHWLNDRMEIVKSTPKLKAAFRHIEGVDDGFIAVLGWRGKTLSFSGFTDRRHVLVRYSGALEKRWYVVLPGEPGGVVPMAARGQERFYVAVLLENLSVLDVRGNLESFRVHDVPELRRRLYVSEWPFEDVYDNTVDEEKRVQFTNGIWDACSNSEDDAVILADWVVAKDEPATRLHYCRFDEAMDGFRTYSYFVAGRFLGFAHLSGNSIAALGRLTYDDDRWVIAVIDFPDIRHMG